MSIFLRLIIIIALGLFATALFIEAAKLSEVETPDPSRVAVVFVLIIFVTVAMGSMIALSIAPAIGERIGSFFFNPNQTIEKDVHSDAIAAVNRGDYEEAIAEFEKVLEREPMDTVSINEIVQLTAVKLEDPNRAAAYLEEQLDQEWPADHSAFLASRLVDVYWNHLQDAERARTVLIQVAEAMPDTRFAANAQHRLREIEQSFETSEVDEPLFLRPTAEHHPAEPGTPPDFLPETEEEDPGKA